MARRPSVFGGRLLLLLLGLLAGPLAHAAPQLQLTLTASVPTVAAGTAFDYTIQYKCASITENCAGATVTDTLPAALSGASGDVTLAGSAHTTAQTYTTATRTAKWTFVNPLPAGSTGQLKMSVKFPLGTTPNGATAVNTASMAATGAVTASSDPVTVTATATNTWTIVKTRVSGGTGAALDQETVYQIQACPNGSTLNINNVTLTDTLPAGAVFVNASNGGTHANGSVTWTSWGSGVNVNNLTASGGCASRTVTVIFPTGGFNVGNTVTNNALLTATVATTAGEASITPLQASLTHAISAGAVSRTFTKRSSVSTLAIGQPVIYYFDIMNNGNVALDNFSFEDAIPPQFNVTQIRSGATFYNVAPTLAVEYQTNTNLNWTPVTGFPRVLTSSSYTVNVSSLNLDTGVYITKLRYTYLKLPPAYKPSGSGSTPGFQADLLATDRSNAAVMAGSVISNVGTFSHSYNGVVSTGGSTVNLTVADNRPAPKVDKSTSGVSSVLPNDTVTYQLSLNNANTAGGTLSNPVLGDLLNAGLDYVANSATVTSRPAGMPNPVVETLVNYKNTGRTLLRFRWDGASAYELPINTTATLQFKVKVKPGTLAGIITNTGYLLGSANPSVNTATCYAPLPADANDLNGNGNTAETLCASKANTGNITVNTTAAMESVMLVKGQLDAGYSKYPANGLTVAGGSLLYRLQVSNVGNVPMKNVQVIDILPDSGDSGVLDPQSRLSVWRPNLIAPVEAPAGVVVYYSTHANLCRTELNYAPDGCVPAEWSITPPADITTVQALKFDFGNVVVNPLDKLELNWPMRAPIGAPTKGEIAWNSFGYVATRADNLVSLLPTEPIKVGVAIQPPAPPSYGNFVWLDSNGNGIQDAGEVGLNGVRVDLYQAGGARVDSTLTTSDGQGKLGFYQFTNMQPGSYYAAFYPPAGYAITQAKAGGDPALDSDADPSSGVTPATKLVSGQVDYDWDMGLQVSNTGSIGNYVWFDRNGNGIQDEASNDGLNGVTVKAYASGNAATPVATTVSGNDVNGNPGYYRLDGLPPGTYVVQFTPPAGSSFTATNTSGSTAQTDSDANASNGQTVAVSLVAGQYDAGKDAGIKLPVGTASLGDRVWLDANNNGLYEPFSGEQGIDGVRVNIYRDNDGNGAFTPNLDQYYATTSTFTAGGNPGFYSFSDLPAGSYIVQIDPVNFQSGKPLAGLLGAAGHASPTDGADNDNNGYLLAGYGAVSAAVQLTDAANMSLDFGFTPAYSLGNRVFLDDGAGGGTANDGLQNGSETGIAGVAVSLFSADADGNPKGSAIAFQSTDAQGHYRFDELTTGSYVIAVDKAASKPLQGMASSTGNSTDFGLGGDLRDHGKDTPLPAGSVLPKGIASTPVTLTVGSQPTGESLGTTTTGQNGPHGDANNNLTADFGFTPVYRLGDKVWFDTDRDGIQQPDERGIAGVAVNLYAADGSTVLQTTRTDGAGRYQFEGLAAGGYAVGFAAPDGYQFSPQNQGSGSLQDSFDSDADSGTGKTAAFSLSANDNPTVDAGLSLANGAKPAQIGDLVWFDTNRDGLIGSGEPGLAGVTVKLWDENHAKLLATSVSDGNGSYQFAGLPAASYVLEFVAPAGYALSPKQADASRQANDSDADPTSGLTAPAKLAAGQDLATLDAGLYLSDGAQPAKLGDKVWYDTDNNGMQDTAEPGVPGVTVNLYNAEGTALLATVKTDGKGAYQFGGLPAQTYTMEFILPQGGYAFSAQNQGGDGALDSDADVLSGRVTADLSAAQTRSELDAGISMATARPINIGDSVWLDGNGNLAFNDGENLANAQIVLYDSLGQELARLTTTATDSNYLFTGLGQGSYRVAVDKSTLPTNAALIADPDGALDGSHDLNKLIANIGTVDFGYSTHVDFGDLPVSYSNGLAGNNPRHAIKGVRLGDADTDAESDGQATANASGDNLNGATPNDETGVSFAGPWTKGQNASVKVIASANGVLNAWADWNNNGQFDSGERILSNQAVMAGANMLTVAVPDNAVATSTAVRFRATDAVGQGGDSPTGLAASGEVEDYRTLVYVAGNVGSIAGQVRNDSNGDGNLQAAYPGLAGAVVSLYTDPNGDGDPTDGQLLESITTTADGSYLFAAPVLGKYVVVETNPAGYTSTNDAQAPNNDKITVAMPSFAAITGRDFLDSTNPHAGSIAGQVRKDTRGDGNLSASDYPGMAGVAISLYTDPNGDGNPSDGVAYAAMVTDGSGNYRFDGLPLGGYVVMQTARPVALPPYFPTNDAVAPNDDKIPLVLTLAHTDAGGADFLNCQNPTAAPKPLDFVMIDSKPLTDPVGTQGQGSVSLFKDINAADLEAYRQDNGGMLAFGVNVNEAKEGSETAASQGVAIKEAVLTLTFSDGQQKTHSIASGSCYTETYSLVSEINESARQPRYTLLGSDDANREGAQNAVQNTYDSTLKCYVPDTLDSSGHKVVNAVLDIRLVQAAVAKGDPEAFYDFSGPVETLAILNAADRRFIDQYQSGGLQAPAKAMTNPDPIHDPLAVASWNSFPSGNTHYFVAYEDMYPSLGDYDFNDGVVAYQVSFGLNSNNQVVRIVGTAYFISKGAAYSHDWHLRITLPAAVKTAVKCTTSLPTNPQTDFPCTGAAVPVSAGTVDVLAFQDTRKIFPNPLFTDYRKNFTNTLSWPLEARNYLQGPKSVFSIALDQPVDPAAVGKAPFDPYLYVRDTKQTVQLLEVNPAIKDVNGYPYAMLMPTGWNWPYERIDIRTAYPKFNTFTSSQGTSAVDWYNFPAKGQYFAAPKPSVWAW